MRSPDQADMDPQLIKLIEALARKAVDDGEFAATHQSVSPAGLTPGSMLVNFDTLSAVTGYERAGDITRSLRDQGVRYFLGKGGLPWTTQDLINAAGGLRPGAASDTVMYRPEDIL